MNSKPILHRDDPEAEPLVGNIKVTRDDWLNVAMDVLISDGVDQIKVLNLAERMAVSRSSFYWYFKSRQELLDALLARWQATNTAALVAQAEASAETITAAVCNVHRCVVNTELFDTALDFAVRDWARKSGKVRRALDQSDARRLEALHAMFARYGYSDIESETRARVLYYMQIGYDLAQLNEPIETRVSMVPHYLYAFTGVKPKPEEVEEFSVYSMRYWKGELT
ncbi:MULTISPECIES: TetR/AcrR family transcriptional regulator [unclassified Ruegeria]|uniref:TetR/AcrR family transcriptional regulator n=1 Tax=unclassified Ruegeria TaxID=2625375 RepID=UPI0014889E0F|nr:MULTISPECIES: TetR/AcrR family transcriptional regulator [unclassified Ruegeria]NOD77224.1 TetR family transcriptional regulator [Ruegeria sp. HKCCD4332]NOD89695.1 TetR family transcriptional regulator [Ruegeria sp. HKCCD4318]NOE14018.1 TetR family transcriptional regulator [Ruegeria sp. HKCCD4318-2]NOG08045.1 TetR/AcrR family transcriptional regulator [Ruegeria sp. HKCCD4315]